MSQQRFGALRVDRRRRGAGLAVARLAQELANLRETIGLRPVPAPRSLSELLSETDALLRSGARRIRELQAASPAGALESVATLNEALARVGDLREDIREYRLAPELCAHPGLQASLGRLWRITSSTALVETAALEASRGCGLERVTLARIEHADWTLEVSHPADPARPDRAGAWADGALGGGAAEQRMLQTRAPALVRAEELAGASQAYVIAPVVLGRAVVGCFYGDHGPDGPEVDEVDRDQLAAFATAFATAVERATLVEHLVAQREAVRREVLGVFDGVGEAGDDAGAEALDVCGRPAPPAFGGEDDDILTARQRQVLGLIARGATNAGIADELDISEDTVKTHAKNIMAKLSAHSRAEALSKYLLLTAERRRGPS